MRTPSSLERAAVSKTGLILTRTVQTTACKHQSAAPVLRSLVIDGVRVRPFPTGKAARLETGMGANPHADAIHVRRGEVPLAHARNASPSLGEVPRGARVPSIARPPRPMGVNHEVPARKRGANGLPIARLPEPLPINEAADIPLEATTPSGGAPIRLGG